MGLWKQTFRIGRTLDTEERQVGRGVRTERGDVITRSGSAEDEVWRKLRYEGGVGGHGSEVLRMEGERRWLASSALGWERLLEWAALLLKTAEGENVSELNDVGDVLGAGTLSTQI